MWWRNRGIAKGTGSIWSVMFSVFAILAVVWLIAMNVSDPIWRWSIAGIGTIICLGSPGGLVIISWLSSSEFRKQHYLYRRGGPLPGYPADEPWQGSSVREIFDKYTDDFVSPKKPFRGISKRTQARNARECIGHTPRREFLA
jgi:hypothetical protein